MGDSKLFISKLSEEDMVAREACYHQHCMKNSGINFASFPTISKIILKKFRKVSRVLSFIKDSLQSSDEIAPFIKLSVTKKFYCHCSSPIVSVNATRLKENSLKFNPNLEANSQKKEDVFSFKDDLAARLHYKTMQFILAELHMLFILTPFIKKEIRELHTTLLPKR